MTKTSHVEMLFCVDGIPEYSLCWLGKIDYSKGAPTGRTIYWYGLAPDGLDAYEYDSLQELTDAQIFGEESLMEIWDLVTVAEFNGCDVGEWLK